MARLGLIGLGRMGRAVGGRLLAAGHPLAIWNRTADRMRSLRDSGGSVASGPREVAVRADLVFTILSDAAAVESVVAGPGGILEGAHEGLVLVEMSTIAPSVSRRLAGLAQERGIAMLDAPISGNPAVVRAGKAGLTIGGDSDILEQARPILAAFAGTIIHAGASGQGAALKLVNNLALAIALEATAEAMILARSAGLDPRHLLEIAAIGGAQMRQMETRGQRMISRDFTPSFTLDGLDKDIATALDLAAETGAVLPAGSIVRAMLRAGRAQGQGELDPAALITVLEGLCGMK